MNRATRIDRTADTDRRRRLDAAARPQIALAVRAEAWPWTPGSAPTLGHDRLERATAAPFAPIARPAKPLDIPAALDAEPAAKRLAGVEALRDGGAPRREAIDMLRRLIARETDVQVLSSAAQLMARLRGDGDMLIDLVGIDRARGMGQVSDARAVYMIRRMANR